MLRRVVISVLAMVLASIPLAPTAQASVGTTPTVDGDIAIIYNWYGGKITKAQIREVAQDRANDIGMALIEVLEKVISEATAASSTHNCWNKDGTVDRKARFKLKTAMSVGDIFVATNGLAWFGHAGMYYTRTSVVHHPGLGQLSKKVKASKVEVGCGSVMDSVDVSVSKRKAAATYSTKHYVGRKYNWMFPFYNKGFTPSGRVNCSQLVWLAYDKSKTDVDLDGNGGWAVYPWDLDRSPHTKTYKVIKK